MVEIRSQDLIKRPADGPGANTTGKTPLAWLKEIKNSIEQAKAIVDALKDSGINLPGLAAPGRDAKTEIHNPGDRQDQQLQLVLSLLKANYGELTVNEVIEELIKQYGHKKLKELIK